MLCTRCGGLLIRNWWNSNECVQSTELLSTRCVNCGSIDDAVICANRRQQHRTSITLARGSVHHANLALISRMKPVHTQLLEHGTTVAS